MPRTPSVAGPPATSGEADASAAAGPVEGALALARERVGEAAGGSGEIPVLRDDD